MAIVKVNFFSESLLRMVNLMCVIPVDKREMDGEGLRPIDKPMKTLYLMHGIYGGEYDWITRRTETWRWSCPPARTASTATRQPCTTTTAASSARSW